MASSYTQIYQYRDPQQLDISSTLGKAASYKQNLYDQNTSMIQQLVNQYAGMDLMRGIDQNYLGDRLKTLTNYVNQVGAMDWSRRSVYNDVTNYIGQALDQNVMAGIASTQRYRKHQAEMDDLKRNKPDLYAAQNDWLATRDLERYMTSNQLGDQYRQGTYVPYTDVKKEILENSKYLKDFGVETYIDSSDNNVYFKNIKKGEKISREKAAQYIDLVIGDKGRQQLMIDGVYQYKDTPTELLKQNYDSFIDDSAKEYTNQAKANRLLAMNSSKEDKARYIEQANYLDKAANDIINQKGLVTSRDGLASNLYLNGFKKKWSDMLSYDRITDWKIDDSGMQVAKFQQQVRQDNNNNEFKKAELKIKREGLNIDRQKLTLDLMSKGMKLDKDGNPVIDPNSPLNGIVVNKDINKLKEIEKAPVEQTFKNFDVAHFNAMNDGVQGLKDTLNDPNNAKIKDELGFENRDARYIMNNMIMNPNRFAKLERLLDPNTRNILIQAQGAYKAKQGLLDKTKSIDAEVKQISNGLYASPDGATSIKRNFNLFQGGLGVDDNGNLVKKDVRYSNTKQDQLVREIGVLNNMRATEKNSNSDNALLYQKSLSLFNQLKFRNGEERAKAKEALIYQPQGFFEGLKNDVLGLASANPFYRLGAKTLDKVLNYVNKDDSSSGTYNTYGELMKHSGRGISGSSFFNSDSQSSSRGSLAAWGYNHLNDAVLANTDISSIGNSDINGVHKASETMNRVKATLKKADGLAKIINANNTYLNAINIDMASTTGKEIMANLKASMPVGTQIQKDGNAIYKVDIANGIANVTIPVKEGKEYVGKTMTIPLNEVPRAILGKIDTNQQNPMFSAKNPYSLGYKNFTEIPANKQEYYKQVDDLPFNQRMEVLNNPNPPKTQDAIVKDMETMFGKELVTQNKNEIQKMLNSPMQFEMVSQDGQWTIVGKQNGQTVMMRKTGEEYINPNLTDKLIDKLGTSQIIENVKQLLRSKQ